MKRTKPEAYYCECGDHAWAPLTRGFVALVSPEDADHLASVVWTAHRNPAGRFYAKRGTKEGTIYLHRQILGNVPDEVDHRSLDGLDNRRSNIRPATKSQNAANRGAGIIGYRGVQREKRPLAKPWRAALNHKAKTYHLGRFATAEEAAAAHDRKAIEIFGPFARLNFPVHFPWPESDPTDESQARALPALAQGDQAPGDA
jgi:hypothetical protein